jgi:hypothetical protein
VASKAVIVVEGTTGEAPWAKVSHREYRNPVLAMRSAIWINVPAAHQADDQ